MLNILINAYAVSPSWGSEQGMGWNWVINIAKFCNVFVITEGEYREEIEGALLGLPQKNNIHFYYNPVADNIRKICWNQGDWRFYYYYRKWQKKTLEIAKDIIKENNIDVIHQLNMIGFREPGYLWKIKGIPYVWGPIGGMDMTSLSMMKGEPFKNKVFEVIKNIINYLQIHCHYRVCKAINRSCILLTATKASYDKLLPLSKKSEVYFINETGTDSDINKDFFREFSSKQLNLLWVGKFAFRKKLDVALNTIRQISDLDIRLNIAGTGNQKEVDYYKRYANKLGISDKITWLGKVPHKQMSELMSNSDLFFFTSISEATSTVVPEAISHNLPILCFNVCGFGPLVKDRVGETIELSNPKQAASEFADKIRYFVQNRDILKEYSIACDKYKYELSWEWKAKKAYDLYLSAIERHNSHV